MSWVHTAILSTLTVIKYQYIHIKTTPKPQVLHNHELLSNSQSTKSKIQFTQNKSIH